MLSLLDDIEFVLRLDVMDLEPYYEELQVISAMLIGLDRATEARAAPAVTPPRDRYTQPAPRCNQL